MVADDLCMDYLTLFFKELVLSEFLEALSHVDQLGMQLVNLALFSQLQQVSFVMSVEINRNWLVSTISRNEAYIERLISIDFRPILWASQTDRALAIAANDVHLCLFWFFSRDLVEEFNGFARLFVDIEAEGFASDTEVEGIRAVESEESA